MIIQTLCYLLHLIGSLQNALQYLQLEEPIESYRNLKPNKFYYRNLNSTKFHRIFLSFSLCPCSSSLKIATPQQGISITSLLLSTLPNLGPPLDSTNSCISCIVDGLPPEHLTIPNETDKLHPIINARFLWISMCFPGGLSLPYTILSKPKKNKKQLEKN